MQLCLLMMVLYDSLITLKNNTMKTTIRSLMMLSACMGIVSCADDFVTESLEPQSNDSEGFLKEIIVNAPEPIILDETADTRNQIDIGSSVITSWIEGDTLGIFPDTGGAQVEFPIGGSGNSARFDGGGWSLKNSSSYAAYYPFSKTNYYRWNYSIINDYRVQVQQYNNSTYHLGAYDFQATSTKATPQNGSVSLNMKRLDGIMIFEITVPFTDTYTEIELYPDNSSGGDGWVYPVVGILDISGDTPYVANVEFSKTLNLGLNNISLNEGETLMAYMMYLPNPDVATGHRLVLHGNKGVYEAILTRKQFSGTKKWVVSDLTDAKIRNLNLIAAAEQNGGNSGVSFIKDENGYVNVNNATNRQMFEKVVSISVENKSDNGCMAEIGYFPKLEKLYIYGNNLTSLDVSKNQELWLLNCSNNFLQSLDLSKNTKLKNLNCSGNKLQDIDVSHNQALEILNCYRNTGLRSLDVTHNPALKELYCYNTQISSLDLFYNKALTTLYCYDNDNLFGLDVSGCTALQDLRCNDTNIGSFGLSTTGCTALKTLYCYNTGLYTLDLSTNTALSVLYCYDNFLNSLDLSKNINLTYLRCINNSLTSLNVSNNTKLQQLFCGNNKKITTLDTSALKSLKTLNVSGCSGLLTLYCNGTSSSIGALTSLNVSGCTALRTLNCAYNKLTSLNVSASTNLVELRCNSNYLPSLDVTSNTKLLRLFCNDNLMTSLSITKCTSMQLYGRVGQNWSYVYCGNQWYDSSKTTYVNLTLYYTSSNGGVLQDTDTLNSHVSLNLQNS